MDVNLGARRPIWNTAVHDVSTPPVRIETLSSRLPPGPRHSLTDPDARQFLFVLAGSGSIELEGTSHPLRPGSLAMIVPGPEAALRLEAGAEGVHMSLSEIFFGSEVIRAMPGLASHAVYWNETYYRCEVSHYFESEPADVRRHIYDEMTAASARLGLGCDPAIGAYALVILFGAQWAKLNTEHRINLSDAQDLSEGQLVSHFRQMVGLNLARHLRVQAYCDSMGVSHDRLTASCKAVLGMTPTQVIQQRMVLEAKRALLHSDRSVSEIGYDLGFSDVSYFSRFIKLRTGLSPRQLRDSGRLPAVA